MLCRKVAANRLFGVWRPTPFFLPKSVSIGFCFLPRLRFLFTISLLTFCIIAHCARFVKGFLHFCDEFPVSTGLFLSLPLTIHSIPYYPFGVNTFFMLDAFRLNHPQ